MNSPIDHIEEGILDGSWETVCEGFERLTGKSVPIPNQMSNNVVESMLKIHDIATTTLGLDAVAEICVKEAECSEAIAEICQDKKEKSPKKKKKAKKTRKKKTKSVSKEGEDSSLVLQDADRTPGPRSVGTVQHITNVPDPEEVRKNKIKAAKTGRANLAARPVAKKFKVKCNECPNRFNSDRPSGEMGQKCPKCLLGRKSQFV